MEPLLIIAPIPDDLDEIHEDRNLRPSMRKDFLYLYEMRVCTLKASYGITTEEALGVIVREQMAAKR